jgi:hypothetical protein
MGKSQEVRRSLKPLTFGAARAKGPAGRKRRRALLGCALVALALAAPSAVSADAQISGHASGMTIRTGDGSYLLVGTYTDALGAPGTYHGSYRESTTGYTSCRGQGIGVIYCDNPPFSTGLPYRCNLIAGEITFRSLAGKEITFDIGSGGFAPPDSRIVSGVCQQQADPNVHDTYLLLLNRTNLWPATTEEFSRGYGLLNYAVGSMIGVSSPRGSSPIYADELTLQLNLFSP